MKYVIALSLVLLIAMYCAIPTTKEYPPATKPAGDREYGYQFVDTTGLVDYVMIGGKENAIQFRFDSDPGAVASLRNLGAEVVYHTDGKNMVLIGKLHPKILMTPDRPNMAATQPYREFTLRGWRTSIKTSIVDRIRTRIED